MDPEHKPFHHRIRHHITRTSQVCDEWCREARMYDRILPAAFLAGILIFLVYFVTIAPPLSFPSASLLKIPKGSTVEQVALLLKEKNIIHSVQLFKVIERLYGKDTPVVSGEYFFPGPENIFIIVRRLVHGDRELVPVRVRIPEGATAQQIADLLEQKVPDFESEAFFAMAKPREGMLFPDTYLFLPGEEPSEVLSALLANFELQITSSSIAAAIASSTRSEHDIVVMASILEKEAATFEDRKMIAGLLWHRIDIGMKLQVDAVFPYIIGVNTFELTKADLKTDSPYNTYLYKGLPPGPISNPSLSSILAAAKPDKNKYVFYLSDMQSKLHFCATYACQLANQKKYLGN